MSAGIVFTWATSAGAATRTIHVVSFETHGSVRVFEALIGAATAGERVPPVSLRAVTRSVLSSLGKAEGAHRVVFFAAGYDTKVLSAVRTAARLSSALSPQDAIVVIDWGSEGKRLGYAADRWRIRTIAPAFGSFLTDFRSEQPELELDIFADSLGTRLVVLALPSMSGYHGHQPVVEQVVLAAPDMTINDYERAINRKPQPVRHITLYISRKDNALLVSTLINFHRALGRYRLKAPVAQTDVVDATRAKHSIDGHGYALHDPDVIRDIAMTLDGFPVPHNVWLRCSQGAVEWTYVPADAVTG